MFVLGLFSFQSGCNTFIATLLTGSDMFVINSGPKRKDYSDHSSYSYSGIGPKERALRFSFPLLFVLLSLLVLIVLRTELTEG